MEATNTVEITELCDYHLQIHASPAGNLTRRFSTRSAVQLRKRKQHELFVTEADFLPFKYLGRKANGVAVSWHCL